jgi:hypothetical protein
MVDGWGAMSVAKKALRYSTVYTLFPAKEIWGKAFWTDYD